MSDQFKFLHTMIRVNDLQQSVDFYTKLLGMKELRRTDVPDGKYTLVFVGYGDESNHTVLELTYNYDTNHYDHGTAFGHFALGVPDIHATVETLRAAGVKISREPGPVKFGKTVIAFIEDPNGYKIELIERR
jgi:lactoylglutathione lyase